MPHSAYEIWRHEGRQIWKIYIDVTDDIRTELYRQGWSHVVEKQVPEEIIEQGSAIKHPPKRRRKEK